MLKPQFFGTFCDDVRHEITGKYTLVGCYGTDMGVPDFPFNLVKLCFSFSYLCDPEQVPESIEVAVRKDGKDLYRVVVAIEHNGNGDPHNQRFMMNGGFEMLNLMFDGACVLDTEATVDGQVLQGPQLRVARVQTLQNHSAQH